LEYLVNTNLIYALAGKNQDIDSICEAFFINQLCTKHDVIASPVSDFMIDGLIFEVGGKSKNQKQITDLQNAYIVKDNIEFGYQNIVPLWTFGLNY